MKLNNNIFNKSIMKNLYIYFKIMSTNYSTKILFFFTLLFLLLTSQFALATVYTVDNRPESGAQYTQIVDAIASASADDTIYVHPSPTTYNNFTIDKTITIVGPGHDPANFGGINAEVSNITLTGTCPNTVITGMSIVNIDVNTSAVDISGLHLINNKFSTISTYNHCDNWIVEGNYFSNGYPSTSINANNANNMRVQNNIIGEQIYYANHTDVFTNNLFINNSTSSSTSIFIGSTGTIGPIVTNNMFIFTSTNVTTLTSTGAPTTYTDCLTWIVGGGGTLDTLPGTGNLNNTNPAFNDISSGVTDFYNNDYSLAGGSPAIGKATDGGDIGIFGRGFPFDIHGRPHSMPYPEIMTILNTVVEPGQDLNVVFKASQKN